MRPIIELPPGLDYALKIRHAVSAGWEQWYLLIGDCHWDSPECYLRLLHKHLKEAKERDALIIDIGDFFDAISGREDPRGSKGTFRPEHQKLNYLDALISSAVREFSQYAGNIVYMGTGNHEQAITVKRETDITRRFVEELNRNRKGTPIHRAGYTGWIRLMFANENGSCRSSYYMKIEHGIGGNSPVTKGVIQTNRRAARTEGATFIVSGHIHERWSMENVIETLNSSTGRIEQRPLEHIQVGSYKRDFRTDGSGTWHMMKSGATKPVGGCWLHLWTANGHDVQYDVTKAWVPYADLVDYLPHTSVVAEVCA